MRDSCQTSVCEKLNTLLYPRSSPVCIQAKLPSIPLHVERRRHSRGQWRSMRSHLGLESMDIVHSPSDSSAEQGPTQDSTNANNRIFYKSCILQFHDLVDGQPVGNLSVMSRFIKVIYELQLPKPKTSTTCSVGQVLVFLQDRGPFENLSLQDVSLQYKLAKLVTVCNVVSFNFGSSCA